MKKLIKDLLAKFRYQIVRTGVRTDFVAWAKDVDFEKASVAVEPFTMLERDRLYMLWQFARQAARLGGATAQVGVFRGGSARLIAYAQEKQTTPFFVFDTFEGMPKVNPDIDLHKEGDFIDTSIDHVKKVFAGVSRAVFCQGIFPQTSAPAKDQTFSFVYIDVDIYQSTLDSLHFFYPRLMKGGFIMFDDYMGKNTPGVKKALDEFLVDKKEVPIITTVGQCILIKQ
ncbi:MAG: class I SAM-dependent methyltransferase [Candidatus Pacebacteria bacterium]|jgi:hypothetical protein|nr:class I SAM-dependent methyltransferase [Candidatus Paceibacterota bacterium]